MTGPELQRTLDAHGGVINVDTHQLTDPVRGAKRWVNTLVLRDGATLTLTPAQERSLLGSG